MEDEQRALQAAVEVANTTQLVFQDYLSAPTDEERDWVVRCVGALLLRHLSADVKQEERVFELIAPTRIVYPLFEGWIRMREAARPVLLTLFKSVGFVPTPGWIKHWEAEDSSVAQLSLSVLRQVLSRPELSRESLDTARGKGNPSPRFMEVAANCIERSVKLVGLMRRSATGEEKSRWLLAAAILVARVETEGVSALRTKGIEQLVMSEAQRLRWMEDVFIEQDAQSIEILTLLEPKLAQLPRADVERFFVAADPFETDAQRTKRRAVAFRELMGLLGKPVTQARLRQVRHEQVGFRG